MKKYFFIFVFLCFGSINAQRIILCKAYTNNGEPIDYIYSSTLILDQSVCILFLGENKIIKGQNVYLNIDRISGETRQNHFNKALSPQNENWVASVYKFNKEGKFEIYFTNETKQRFSTLTVNVVTQKPTKKIEPPVIIHYPEAEITLCEKIQSGKPVGTKRIVSLQYEGGAIYIYMSNTNPFNTEQILISTWRKEKYGLNYSEFIDSKKYEIDPQWNDTFFKYKFTKPGDYKIELYDKKELLIKTAYISVTN
ncbi:hypothetical protein C0389_02150 [bacterium]|nr:hypothetical protein [bacterium]